MKKFRVKVNDNVYEVEVEEIRDEVASYSPAPKVAPVHSPAQAPARPTPPPQKVAPSPAPARDGSAGGLSVVKAPMPGVILSIKVNQGDEIDTGDVLCVLEAMKLENELQAERPGVLKEVRVTQGQNVNAGEVLFVIE